MNRAEMRRRAREINTPHKLEMLERQIRAAIKKEYEERTEKEMEAFIRGYTTVVIYVLWYGFGFKKRRIKRFMEETEKHLDIIQDSKRYGLTMEDMLKVLKEEGDIELTFWVDKKEI